MIKVCAAIWAFIGLMILMLYFLSTLTSIYVTVDGVTHTFKMG